jgi:hypothetical protein
VKRLDPERLKKTRESVWSAAEHPDAWRVVWQYRHKRVMRDEQALILQRNRALEIIKGEKLAKRARFARGTDEEKNFNETECERT